MRHHVSWRPFQTARVEHRSGSCTSSSSDPRVCSMSLKKNGASRPPPWAPGDADRQGTTVPRPSFSSLLPSVDDPDPTSRTHQFLSKRGHAALRGWFVTDHNSIGLHTSRASNMVSRRQMRTAIFVSCIPCAVTWGICISAAHQCCAKYFCK